MLRTSTWNASGSLVGARVSGTKEDEVLAAGRDDVDVVSLGPEVATAREVLRSRHLGPRRNSRVYDSAAIFTGKVVGQHLGHRVPVAGRKVRLVALVYSACRVFQPRCRPAELLESRERGVQVALVEDLSAVDQVAFDRENG